MTDTPEQNGQNQEFTMDDESVPMIDTTNVNFREASDMPDDVKAKQDISKALKSFDKVLKKTSTKVIQENMTDPRFKDAVTTRTVPQQPNQNFSYGAQMDKFGVFSIPNNRGKTRYTVADMANQQPVIENLFLSESANAIVKLLNRGYSFYSPEIRTVLDLEEKYVKHYQDASTFKRKCKDAGRDQILETRFEDAKDRAIAIKEQLIEFNNKIK